MSCGGNSALSLLRLTLPLHYFRLNKAFEVVFKFQHLLCDVNLLCLRHFQAGHDLGDVCVIICLGRGLCIYLIGRFGNSDTLQIQIEIDLILT